METSSDFRHGRHCITNIHIHLVFVTKYRKCVFTPEILSTMKSVFSKICEDFEAVLVESDGERDHVHLLINYPPKVSISKLVNSLKGASSKRLRRIHPELKACYWKKCALVTKLFGCKLRRSAYLHYPAIYRRSRETLTARLA